jgi:hypothetical protein
MRRLEELLEIAVACGGMKLDARLLSVDDLTKIALVAGGSSPRTRLCVTNTEHLAVKELRRIALSGDGCVVFDNP